MATKYRVKTKTKNFFVLDKWMTVLEMRSFGWRYKGQKTEAGGWDVTVNVDNGTATARRRFYTYLEFRRDKPYSRNFFFGLLEFLMSIMSWIRRFLIIPIWIIAIICAIAGFAGASGGDKIIGMDPCLFAGIMILVVAYLPSALFCLCGWGFRKIFKVDEKHRQELIDHGIDPESGL